MSTRPEVGKVTYCGYWPFENVCVEVEKESAETFETAKNVAPYVVAPGLLLLSMGGCDETAREH